MYFKLYVILSIAGICISQPDDSRWIWGGNGDGGRTDKTRIVTGDRRYNGELVSKPLFLANNNYNGIQRYEITEEPDADLYRPLPNQQYRPDNNRPLPYEPDFVRPTNTLVNYNRPDNRPYENTYHGNRPTKPEYLLHNLKPGIGTNGRPILTGPTPSWEDDGQRKYKDYDVCKCVRSFNCNTPGIKFGTCDTNKQYCCYKSRQGEGNKNVGGPVTNVYERPRPRPVLAGPGGPVDVPGKPYQKQRPTVRPTIRPTVDPDRDLDEAYRKGLASTIHRYETLPDRYQDRDGNRYTYEGNSHSSLDNFRNSHPSKYGLYEPSVNL